MLSLIPGRSKWELGERVWLGKKLQAREVKLQILLFLVAR